MSIRWMTAAVVIAVTMGGCVKREERITVAEDGSVKWKIEVSGDRKDMESGAPLMAELPNWELEQHVVVEDDGKESMEQEARITIAPGGEIPATYPTKDAEGERLAMRHPTTLTIERRPDGTYYHFRRAYEPRPSAFVDVWWNKLIESYRDKDPAKLGDDEALKFVEGLGEVARQKHRALLRAATLRLSEPLPQDVLLGLFSAADRVIEAVDSKEVLAMLRKDEGGNDNGGNGSEQLDALGERIATDVDAAALATLRSAGLSAERVDEFASALRLERRKYAITEDYFDDGWEIKLSMPGALVGHNGDKVDEEGRIMWELEGEHFYDRMVELPQRHALHESSGLRTHRVRANRDWA